MEFETLAETYDRLCREASMGSVPLAVAAKPRSAPRPPVWAGSARRVPESGGLLARIGAWWAGLLVAVLLVAVPMPAKAETLTGVWRINGLVVVMAQDGGSVVVRTVVRRDDTGAVALKMEGTVSRTESGALRFLAVGDPISIVYAGQRCSTLPAIAAEGHVVGDFGGRIFKAAGQLGGPITCPDGTTGEWSVDLDGTWR